MRKRIQFILVFLLIFFLSFKVVTDTDLGWHIMVGKHIVENLSVPQTDLFSFSQPDYPYVYHSWMSEVFIFLSYRFLGLWGVTILYSVIVTLSLYLIYKTIRVDFGRVNYFFFLWSVPLASSFAGGRTRVFGFLFLALVNFLFAKFEKKSSKSIWLLVPIFALWANVHASFILGIFVFAIWIFCRFWFETKRKITYGLKVLGLVFWLSVISTLFNPYFLRAWKQAFVMSANSTLALREVNLDWRSLTEPTGGGWIFALIVGATIIIIFFNNFKVSLTQKLQLLLYFLLSVITARFVIVLFVVFIPIANRIVENISSKLNKQILNSISIKIPLLSVYSVLVLMAVGNFVKVSYANESFENYSKYLRNFSEVGILFPSWPYEANLFIKNNHSDRKVLSEANWGSYMVWFNPAQKVFYWGAMDNFIVDGRAFVFEYFDMVNVKPGWEEKLERYKIDAVFLPNDLPLVAVLTLKNNWEKVYDKENVVIFIKRS